jgi:hypothetical protein
MQPHNLFVSGKDAPTFQADIRASLSKKAGSEGQSVSQKGTHYRLLCNKFEENASN